MTRRVSERLVEQAKPKKPGKSLARPFSRACSGLGIPIFLKARNPTQKTRTEPSACDAVHATMKPTRPACVTMQRKASRMRSTLPATRSEERREGKECDVRVDLGGRRSLTQKIEDAQHDPHDHINKTTQQ